MAYKFNDGDGAVICGICKVMIDEGLSYDDYIETYGEKGDICWECKRNKIEKEKVDILDDGWRNYYGHK